MRLLFLATVVLLPMVVLADPEPDKPTIGIKRSTDLIKLDGVIDETSWQQADMIDQLHQQFPYDTALSRVRTEYRATYDDSFVYFSVVARNIKPGGYVVSSLRRDFRGPGLDGVAVIIDTFQDVTNAFFFGVSPAGVQREGLISNGYIATDNLDLSWDNKWYSAVKQYDGYWVAEMAIPYTTIRFKAGATKWNIKYYRQDSKENERAVWPWTPRFFEAGNLNYNAELVWDEPLRHPGSNISIIPYAAGNASKNFLTGEPSSSGASFGGDAKVAVTSSLNLDLTVNPDFSQVEVDRQVTNLERFEIFFPERRQFFLENADLFLSYGHPNARPFFSRRIGVARDPNTGQNIQNQILFGARLSGNINKFYRVGFLNMQTAAIKESSIPSYNYTVATGQRRLGTNSNLRAIFVNRQTFKNDSGDFRLEGFGYNRVLGADYNYSFKNNKYTGTAFFHKQFTPESPGNEYAHGFSFVYSTQRLGLNWYQQIIGQNYNPAVGFVPRRGYKRVSPSGSYRWFPSNSAINNHGFVGDAFYIWDDVHGLSDYQYTPGYMINFQNQSTLNFQVQHTYTFLLNDFDPTNSPSEDMAVKLPQYSDYKYTNASFSYISDPKNLFTFIVGGLHGQYFNGTRTNFNTSLNYRFQPYGVVSIDADFNKIVLPAPYTSADIYVISPRLDLTLTKSVFFTTFVQYNSQYKNMNINTRFQWRFRPVSDLFIVYTDNYFYSVGQPNENFAPKNRAIVIKLTYWFNM